MIHVGRGQRLSADEERAHYLTHENDPADTGYRAFLGRLTEPLVERLAPGSEGLDFGAGPGPTTSVMLREQGFPTVDYDPFFAPRTDVLERQYDFVTCSETAEHFFEPATEFARIGRLIRARGWLGLMTEWVPEEKRLEDWHYARDPTHVSFYRSATMEWIANRFRWTLEVPRRNVALFQVGGGGG